jgi:hypothetical protein
VTALLAGIALVALLLMIGIELAVLRGRRKRPVKRYSHRHARRQPLLEDRMRDVLEEPQTQYGAVFTSFMIWKKDQETHMELFSGDPWLNLNEFTRALVVRHIWRALEKLAKGAVVVVDQPPQEWSAQIDKTFDDHGIDPWGHTVDTSASQFIKDR